MTAMGSAAFGRLGMDRRRRRDEPPVIPPTAATAPLPGLPVAPVAPPPVVPRPDLEAERQCLVQAMIWLRDRLTSAALTAHVDRALAEAAVTRLDLVGTRFDPTWEEAGSTVPTDDPSRDGRVAAVEVEAWFDRDALIRPPVVAVYRMEQKS